MLGSRLFFGYLLLVSCRISGWIDASRGAIPEQSINKNSWYQTG
jgi:hypothetical protein